MQVEIQIDGSCTEPKIIIRTAAITEAIQSLAGRLSADIPQILCGIRDNKVEVLDQDNLIRIFASNGKVFAVTDKGEYLLRIRLYELEERLDARQFVRISNSEIIHLRKVSHFDLSLSGTIRVRLSNGETAYASRRYVAKIKSMLGI